MTNEENRNGPALDVHLAEEATDFPTAGPEVLEPNASGVESTPEDVPSPEMTEVQMTAAETSEADAPAPEPTPEDAPPSQSSGCKRRNPPYGERYYLRYGGVANLEPLDLDGTQAFLRTLGFDGGELRQARAGRGYAAALQQQISGGRNKLHCSYCGKEIAGVDFDRVPDGRLRCTTCSAFLVTSEEEIRQILHRVLDNLENFFGASIKVPIEIQVLEHRKLKKRIRRSISEVDDKSVLILGVAINRNRQYAVLIENGAPRISLIATFAHELTHIWQYTHWDCVKGFPRCTGTKRLLVYEGMAKWAEIQYLYLIGETAVAQREELYTREREDEYGLGFRIYEDTYPLTREAMTCAVTPFIPGKYPFE